MAGNNINPPLFANKIVKKLSRYVDLFSLEGDMKEMYLDMVLSSGKARAKLWYWRQTANLVYTYLSGTPFRSMTMYKNYLKLALRNIIRQKTVSFINISGLAISIACSSLIFMWVSDELSFDQYHVNKDNIYRLRPDILNPNKTTHHALSPPAWGPTVENDYPEAINYARVTRPFEFVLGIENNYTIEENFIVADSTFFEIFTHPFIAGDPKTALTAPFTVVLTEDLANKYYGTPGNAMGKTMSIEGEQYIHTVTGVVENVPANSHIRFSGIASMSTYYTDGHHERRPYDFTSSYDFTFLVLADGTDPKKLESKLPAFLERNLEPEVARRYVPKLQKYTDIHLHSKLAHEYIERGDITYVYMFSVLAIIILVVGFINFVNLSIGQSVNRGKEVGIRKVVGAVKTALVNQFLIESCIKVCISILIALGIMSILSEQFSEFTGKEFSINLFGNNFLLLKIIGVTFLVSLLSGLYPAVYFSSFQPIKVLVGKSKAGNNRALFKNSLVVFQFGISIVLIIGSLTINNQLNYLNSKDLGFNKDNILVIETTQPIKDNLVRFKNRMLAIPNVVNVTSRYVKPVTNLVSRDYWFEGMPQDETMTIDTYTVDHDFVKTMGMELIEGRDFSIDISSDSTKAFIVNEAMVKKMGYENPIGKRVNYRHKQGVIIGVVKDFNYLSLHDPISPFVLQINFLNTWSMLVKISSNNIQDTIEDIGNTWSQIESEKPFTYKYLDEILGNQYKSDQSWGSVFVLFTVISVFISCLGLFGLTLFTMENITKEIGIRKILGSSVDQIILLLSKNLLKLIIIANILGWPLAYYVMNIWLNQFAYRSEMSVYPFLISAFLAVITALLTIGFKTMKAALANPVNALRHE